LGAVSLGEESLAVGVGVAFGFLSRKLYLLLGVGIILMVNLGDSAKRKSVMKMGEDDILVERRQGEGEPDI
jgi:hypothetical protein